MKLRKQFTSAPRRTEYCQRCASWWTSICGSAGPSADTMLTEIKNTVQKDNTVGCDRILVGGIVTQFYFISPHASFIKQYTTQLNNTDETINFRRPTALESLYPRIIPTTAISWRWPMAKSPSVSSTIYWTRMITKLRPVCPGDLF